MIARIRGKVLEAYPNRLVVDCHGVGYLVNIPISTFDHLNPSEGMEVDQYFDEQTAEMMRGFGFIRPANIGPGWRQAANPEASDFERLKALSFKHLLSAHGVPLKDDAHTQLSATIKEQFDV